MEEVIGFEPTNAFALTIFKTVALNLSATLPYLVLITSPSYIPFAASHIPHREPIKASGASVVVYQESVLTVVELEMGVEPITYHLQDDYSAN